MDALQDHFNGKSSSKKSQLWTKLQIIWTMASIQENINNNAAPETNRMPLANNTVNKHAPRETGQHNKSFSIPNTQVGMAPSSGIFLSGMNRMPQIQQPAQQLMQTSPFISMFNNNMGQYNLGPMQIPASLENFQNSQSNKLQLHSTQNNTAMNYMKQSQQATSHAFDASLKSDQIKMNSMSNQEYQMKQAQMEQTKILLYQLQQQQLKQAQMRVMQQAQNKNDNIQNVNQTAGPGASIPMNLSRNGNIIALPTPSMNRSTSSQSSMAAYGSSNALGQDLASHNLQNIPSAQYFIRQQQQQQQQIMGGFGTISVPVSSSVIVDSMNQSLPNTASTKSTTATALTHQVNIEKTMIQNQAVPIDILKNDQNNAQTKSERGTKNHSDSIGTSNLKSKDKDINSSNKAQSFMHQFFPSFDKTEKHVVRNVSMISSSELNSNRKDSYLHQSGPSSYIRRHSKRNVMTKEETESLINALRWEEKLIYVARCVMGGRATNGYFDALSRVNELVDDLEDQAKANRTQTMHMSGLVEVGEILGHVPLDPEAKRDLLKRSPDIALRMITEMGLGATFCDHMSYIIKDILKSIEEEDELNNTDKVMTLKQKCVETGNKRILSEAMKNDRTLQSEKEDNLSTWSFESQRFGSLKVGDFVAAKPQGENIWILSRIVKDWNVKVPQHLTGEEKVKTLEPKHNHVYFQDIEEFNIANKSTYKSVSRMNILRLPQNQKETFESLKQLQKGMRVYAIFPSTTSFYSATIVDIPPKQSGKELVCHLEFDGDEGKSF
jgi:hypothetical protein